MKIKKIIATVLTAAMMASVISSLPGNTKAVSAASSYEYLDQYAYDGKDLGANYSPSQTTFKVWAPSASKVELKLYKTGSDGESGSGVIGTTAMEKNGGIWSITKKEDLKNVYYTYLVTVDGKTNETVDVYAKAVGVNGDRGMVVDLDSTDPEGWENDNHVTVKNQTDAVVWECHVRDFSISPNSGISSSNKGKYLAFTEKGTTLNNDGVHPTGIDYLKELGITHVQLVPSYDYATVDETRLDQEQFNWGYDPKNYNVPEGSYSTDPYHGEVRINEFKQMVQSLHNEGIGVVMDVVYNHTYQFDSWLNRTVPGYYYRYTPDGKLSNGADCGNETRSESAMYRKYMIDSILYWANEYHIDGFRFDLMGIHDVETMNKIRAAVNEVNPDIMLYGEPWSAKETNCTQTTAMQYNMNQVDNEVAAFNDKFRDAIKGSTFMGIGKGFVQGAPGKEDGLKSTIQANTTLMAGSNKWAKQPSQVISYVSAHDNLTLYDQLVLTTKGGGYTNRYDDVVQMNKLAAGIYLTSQGMPFMQAGEEFARTKNGDENSYKSSTSVNQLDWQRTVDYSDIVSWYKGLMKIRSVYSPFRDPTMTSNKTIYFSWGNNCPANVVAYTMYNKITSDKEWNYVGVIHNANDSARTVTLMNSTTLPSQWVVIADGNKAGLESIREISGNTIEVPGRSTMILVDKASYVAHPQGKEEKGSVTVKYVDADTNKEIATSKTYEGVVGSKYNTSAATIDGYDLVSTPSNASGSYIKGNITVTYEYKKDNTPVGTVVVKYIDKRTGKEISSSTTITGKEGTSYSTSAKTIKGYELDSSSNNTTGKYTSGTIEITYYYNVKEVQNLTVHYYNSNNWSDVYLYAYSKSGSTVSKHTGSWPGTKMTSEGNGWYSYEVEEVESGLVIFNNGSSLQEPGAQQDGYSATGEVWIKDKKVFTEDPDNGMVLVKYIDEESGEELETSVTMKGKIGSNYTTTAKNIDGYKLSITPSNANGSYNSGTTTVIYKYSKENIDGQVIVKYIDEESGEELISSITLTGELGSTYKTTAKSISGYELVSKPSNATGYYTNETITVEYKYSKVISQEFTITSYTSNLETPQNIGTKIKLSMDSNGGEGEVKYRIVATNVSNGKKTEIKSYSTSNTVTWKPTEAGIYRIYFKAKDSVREIYKEIRYTIISSGLEINNYKTSVDSPQILGNNIKLSMSATGSGTVTYRFVAIAENGKKTVIKNYSTTSIVTWKPEVAGTYTLYFKAKDSSGKEKYETMKYIIKEDEDELKITRSKASLSSPQATNTKIKLSMAATGGEGDITYKIIIVNTNTAEKTTVLSSKTSKAAYWSPVKSGTYRIYFKAKDASGKEVNKIMRYVIK